MEDEIRFFHPRVNDSTGKKGYSNVHGLPRVVGFIECCLCTVFIKVCFMIISSR